MKRFRFRFGAMPWRNVQETGSSCARWLRRNQIASLQGVLGRYCVKGISAEKNMLRLWNFRAKWESTLGRNNQETQFVVHAAALER